MEEIKIVPPIKIIESEVYNLVLLDSTGLYHYFTEAGDYDGFSRDPYPIEKNPN